LEREVARKYCRTCGAYTNGGKPEEPPPQEPLIDFNLLSQPEQDLLMYVLDKLCAHDEHLINHSWDYFVERAQENPAGLQELVRSLASHLPQPEHTI
jgi:hypothetical protein